MVEPKLWCMLGDPPGKLSSMKRVRDPVCFDRIMWTPWLEQQGKRAEISTVALKCLSLEVTQHFCSQPVGRSVHMVLPLAKGQCRGTPGYSVIWSVNISAITWRCFPPYLLSSSLLFLGYLHIPWLTSSHPVRLSLGNDTWKKCFINF